MFCLSGPSCTFHQTLAPVYLSGLALAMFGPFCLACCFCVACSLRPSDYKLMHRPQGLGSALRAHCAHVALGPKCLVSSWNIYTCPCPGWPVFRSKFAIIRYPNAMSGKLNGWLSSGCVHAVSTPSTQVKIDSLSWLYIGVAPGKVVLNMPNARALDIRGTHEVIVLCPWAVVEFPYGRIDGQMVCDTLNGGNGQFDDKVANSLDPNFGTCRPSQCRCDDGIQNGNEAGVDCGDPECGCKPCEACTCDAFPFDVWRLNVVVFGDVGSPAWPRGADFEGKAAVLGSAWYQAFSINYENRQEAIVGSHWVGGNLTWIGGDVFHGDLEVGGDVHIQSFSVQGDLRAGRDVVGRPGGLVQGNVVAGGTCFWCAESQSSVLGQVSDGVPLQHSLDLQQLETYFLCISTQLAQRLDTPTPGIGVHNEYGHLTITLAPGQRNFVTLAAGLLLAAWKLSIVGPPGAGLVINVPDVPLELNYLEWDYQGVTPGRVVLNMRFANSVRITSGISPSHAKVGRAGSLSSLLPTNPARWCTRVDSTLSRWHCTHSRASQPTLLPFLHLSPFRHC